MDTQFFLQERLSIEEKNYWLQELSEPLPIINVPIDFPQHNKKYSKKLSKTIILDKNLKDGLTKFNSEFNVQAIMIAAYFAWIARLSNEKDILIEVNIDNTAYPIRISIENIKTFKDLLLLVKEKLNNASKYIFIPEEIVKDEIYKTLFQTTFSINSNKKPENESIIDWEIKEQENDMAINVHYDVDLFRTNTIERFIKYYMSILESVIKNQNTSIYSINILTEDEIKIYNELNNTYMELPNYNTIPKMFEEAVHNFPNNIAISSEEGQFTYKQLNERANQLANGLINKGLEKGDFVTIFMKRSLETIIAILGIIKAGGVYVPLDPEHPEERNTYIISDTKSPFIVTKAAYMNKAKELLSNVLSVKEIILMENDINTFSTENPNIDLNYDDLAYIIYTSGSTGKPKGTLIAHKGVVNLVHLIRNQFDINETDILTQFATYSFDASVWDTFGSLSCGARLHLLSSEERISADAFADAIYKTKATFIAILPTVFFNQIATYLSEENHYKFSTVKRVAVGGEALSGEIVRAFQRRFQNSIEIVNLYGPTESTVVATGYSIKNLIPEDQANIPIGKPFNNYEIYIINEENQLCPINVPGEICISSLALAKGYLNQEAKTKEVFVHNPFKENSIIYKSGDIARILENGLIEYVSRKDSQVKVRGHRIEISEIEDNLAKHPEIRDVAIIPKKYNDETILVSYYTTKENKKIKVIELKNFLSETLPSYMIPKYMNYFRRYADFPYRKN
ncbi:non-ribosomal peptide synthetase [Clostridium saccharobutylicum]|uniref:Gramicidin S synthase 2 n=2 Tax=Clostridium saccharobutylicum TaxID=169679 RepID=U5MMI9_CLOSA|nr:amino acid adenylation domain-containing protein [Clostridium saccharobutylicum]AGX42009.1 gramicidin S synthase 2 [Clostridium saccharobutylicum DSM 13864]AQR89287.1 gramicidin S synthase 2 [Clostridium saccharobutylicum]AQR99188.1 gramicidin S synthase 2 [Clostridium saccharobutylicum]AQS13176.1 gramicidin S synthase 2 [Clostridium saccharobutylicum]MBA2906215.1 amino acid adenylation domain-containing protein [Clostridium saccharobutylicum]